jgi:hypothetical protein
MRADGVVFLGLDADGHGAFATDLSGMEAEQAAELAGADRAVDVRMIAGTLSPAEAATVGYGRGLLHRHRSQRFLRHLRCRHRVGLGRAPAVAATTPADGCTSRRSSLR